MEIMIITGATASGKSDYALEIAQKRAGVVINADSMQVYEGLPILSAQPSLEEQSKAPHKLYSHASPHKPYNTAMWLEDATHAITHAHNQGLTPLIVGGTGLYIHALMHGLSPIPDIDSATIIASRGCDMARMLDDLDEETLSLIDTQNPRRVQRAWQVQRATGKTMAQWHNAPPSKPFPDAIFKGIVLEPEKETLWHKIELRFKHALEHGAVEEVQRMMAQNLDKDAQIRVTHGYREIEAMLENRMDKASVIEHTCTQIRQYTKRQRTWFRNKCPQFEWVKPV